MLPVAPVFTALHHVLAQNSWARARLQPFAGRTGRLSMAPWLTLAFQIDRDGVPVMTSPEGSADVDVVLPPDTPLLVLQGADKVMKSARLSGSADFADALAFVLGNLRWDIEEDLSRIVGDIAAHRIVGAIEAFVRWQREAARNLGDNLGEYWVEERRSLVKAGEISSLRDDIATLQADTHRLEQRLQRLGSR